MNRILIATDFSPHAEAALGHAVAFARAFDAELHILNVQVPYGPTSPLVDAFPEEKEAREALRSLWFDGVRLVPALERGIAAAPTIMTYADDHDVDLIVMGSHGRRGVRRLLLGSVTEEVLRGGRWPMLTVHEAETGRDDSTTYRKILLPVDFSPRTEGQLGVATDLAHRFSAEIELLHVVDPPIVPELYGPIGPLAVDLKATTGRALGRLDELADTVGDELTVSKEIVVGRSVHEIEHKAADADLIVMPTHGYRGFDRIMLGSVTEGVLRRAKCPVLVLKPDRDGAEPSVEPVETGVAAP
ncbi:MAG: universal stress protein [Gemmatimonadetes bacterium]|nr:universal stress protein [Gemmatimonadota bacterium]